MQLVDFLERYRRCAGWAGSENQPSTLPPQAMGLPSRLEEGVVIFVWSLGAVRYLLVDRPNGSYVVSQSRRGYQVVRWFPNQWMTEQSVLKLMENH